MLEREANDPANAVRMPVQKLTPVLRGDGDSLRVLGPNLFSAPMEISDDQVQTNEAFANKWENLEYGTVAYTQLEEFQRQWFLDLYGFASETELQDYLHKMDFVIDCGAGAGMKAAWFAELSPETIVVAVDISAAILNAAEHFRDRLPNLIFGQCDISRLEFFEDDAFDFVNCDQVIHHTTRPDQTFKELVRLTKPGRDLTCYVYRKKALPRELLDNHFREFSKKLSHDELMVLSGQLAELGKILSELDIELDVPSIPALGIEGGRQDLQRFLYWNFLKCFWNQDLGFEASTITNYDWYSPSQAYRFSEAEFRAWPDEAALEMIYFHDELACFSGRFRKTAVT